MGDNELTKIKVIGSGLIGKRVLEIITRDPQKGIETYFIGTNISDEENNDNMSADLLTGVDMLIVVWDYYETSGFLTSVINTASKSDILVLGMATIESEAFPTEEDLTYKKLIDSGIDSLFTFNKIIDPINANNGQAEIEEQISQAIQDMAFLINIPAVINLDLIDISHLLHKKGKAQIVSGYGKGEDAALDAVRMAYKSHNNTLSIKEASNYVLLIRGNTASGLEDISVVTDFVRDNCLNEADIVWGYYYEELLKEEVKLIIIASGFELCNNQETKTNISNVEKLKAPDFQTESPSIENDKNIRETFYNLKTTPEEIREAFEIDSKERPKEKLEAIKKHLVEDLGCYRIFTDRFNYTLEAIMEKRPSNKKYRMTVIFGRWDIQIRAVLPFRIERNVLEQTSKYLQEINSSESDSLAHFSVDAETGEMFAECNYEFDHQGKTNGYNYDSAHFDMHWEACDNMCSKYYTPLFYWAFGKEQKYND